MRPTTSPPPLSFFHRSFALILVFFAFFMSALVSQRVFERLPHLEDEVAYLWEARLISHGQTVIPSPQPARPFWAPFVVDHTGERFGKYTLGWPATLSIGVLLGQPWLINALLSALTVALVFRLGYEIFGADTGLIAAALTAFSPMALLLNGTLMGHTAALFTTMLFIYSYWRIERGKHSWRWGLLAGFALGMTIINRPLAGLALGCPFIAWSAVRLIKVYWLERKNLLIEYASFLQPILSDSPVRRAFVPLLGLAVIAGALLLAIPAFNKAATGDSSQNLYLLVWSYDRAGFGEGYGAHTHTLEKGIRQTRWDLSLTAADLFGWETGSITPEAQNHILLEADYWPNVGLSWILLPFGLFLGFKRRWWTWALWLAVGAVIFMQTTTLSKDLIQNREFSYLWVVCGAVWMLIPFAFLLFGKHDNQVNWTWLLFTIPLALVGLHITYWIGSQRYSTRYYFEALAALALLSAIPLGWLAKRWRWPVYTLLTAVLFFSLYTYSMPRIQPLYRFNWVSPELIQDVQARRTDDRPILVIVTGKDVRWRAYGPLMASTWPLLDSDIVAAWDNQAPGVRDAILKLFPNRQIIEMTANGNRACFGSTMEGDCYGEPPTSG